MNDHPVWKKPTLEMALRYAEEKGLSQKDAWLELEAARLERIRKSDENPLMYGYEPSIWRVCDALLGLDFILDAKGYVGYGPKMRTALGFDDPVKVLMINGGQRSGKTTYGGSRCMICLLHYTKVNMWCFSENMNMSIENQQAKMHGYMPPDLRDKDVISRGTYISWTDKNGFTKESFIMPGNNRCSFKTYSMKIEGGNLGVQTREPCIGCWNDERIPAEVAETLEYRISERDGRMIHTFTPVDGYTSMVQLFRHGAVSVKESPAFLCPKNKGDQRLDLSLVPENCDSWLDGERGHVAVPAGCEYEMVPRVMRCAEKYKAIVHFFSSDNPWANAAEVASKCRNKSVETIKERFYGFTERMQSVAFPLFNDKAHVVRRDQLPELKDMTLYQVVDPCGGRNFFSLWIGVTPENRVYVLKEWPNQTDWIPGIGIMEPWAHSSGDNKTVDGRMGGGQKDLGWGLTQYKKEWARLEEWKAYDDGANDDEVARWMDNGDAMMNMFQRFLDARFGNALRDFTTGENITLFDKFDDIGLTYFESISGSQDSIRVGVRMINDALYYNPDGTVDVNNQPSLYICDECMNLIFAMHVWTGQDGQKGATKDPVDCLRMFYLLNLGFVSDQVSSGHRGGGCY
jgi:hypothetical protein